MILCQRGNDSTSYGSFSKLHRHQTERIELLRYSTELLSGPEGRHVLTATILPGAEIAQAVRLDWRKAFLNILTDV
jgi:hypothetical protein